MGCTASVVASEASTPKAAEEASSQAHRVPERKTSNGTPSSNKYEQESNGIRANGASSTAKTAADDEAEELEDGDTFSVVDADSGATSFTSQLNVQVRQVLTHLSPPLSIVCCVSLLLLLGWPGLSSGFRSRLVGECSPPSKLS